MLYQLSYAPGSRRQLETQARKSDGGRVERTASRLKASRLIPVDGYQSAEEPLRREVPSPSLESRELNLAGAELGWWA